MYLKNRIVLDRISCLIRALLCTENVLYKWIWELVDFEYLFVFCSFFFLFLSFWILVFPCTYSKITEFWVQLCSFFWEPVKRRTCKKDVLCNFNLKKLLFMEIHHQIVFVHPLTIFYTPRGYKTMPWRWKVPVILLNIIFAKIQLFAYLPKILFWIKENFSKVQKHINFNAKSILKKS